MAFILAAGLSIHIVPWVSCQRYGGKLVIGVNQDPPTLNAGITSSMYAHFVSGQIFNALIEHDANLNPIPELAESWDISKDGSTYTFRLVRNATWHDGKPFTSADVKFSYDEVIRKGFHPSGPANFASVKNIEAPDPYTVIFRLSAPFPTLMRFMGMMYGGIIPKHIYEGTDILKNERNLKDPIGTGPFKLKEWVKGDHIILVRNTNYWRKGKPYLDQIIYKIIPDVSTLLLAFEKGEVDFIPTNTPLSDIERLRKMPGVTISTPMDAWGSVQILMFNLRHPILGNSKVRQAIAYAIDKQELVEKVRYGFSKAAVAPISSAPVVKWCSNPNLPPYEFDPQKADRLLDEAGYPKGADGIRFRLTLLTNNGYQGEYQKTADVVAARLKEIGIDVTPVTSDMMAHRERLFLKWDFDFSVYHITTGPDPLSENSGFFLSKNIVKQMYRNAMGFNNSRVDWLLTNSVTGLENERAPRLFEFQEILWRELPCIWLFERYASHAFKTDFVGFPPGVWGGARERLDGVWWKGGSEVSPEAIQSAISAAGKELEGLRGQFYDVTAGLQQLEQAKKALEAGDYVKANELVKGAVKLAQPPYAIYGGAIIAAIAVVTAIALHMKRRTQKSITK